jgi:transposase
VGVQVLIEMARARVDRNEWKRRVQRWKDSGLTAKEFAAETGINAGTLQFWRYKLKDGDRPPIRGMPGSRSAAILSSLVEVRAPAVAPVVDQRFEIELANGRRVRVGRDFDAESLRALITAVEAA